jgi:Txe/YoeB family toxin of Txe-Axe toxin-antitoxin module
MLKPNESVVETAIENDPVIKRYHEQIAEAEQRERERVAEVKEQIALQEVVWRQLRKKVGDALRNMHNQRTKIKAMQRRAKIRRRVTGTLGRRISARKRVVRLAEEKKFLRQVRDQFRKTVNLG